MRKQQDGRMSEEKCVEVKRDQQDQRKTEPRDEFQS